jgi:hypothetical protein
MVENANSMDLEQRHVIKFLRIKGLKLRKIARELSSAYDADVYTAPSIKCRLHQIKVGRPDIRTEPAGGRALLDDIDAENVSLLRKYPSASGRTIAESLYIPVSAIYAHLVEKMGLKFLTSLGSPHVNQRVAAEMNRILKSVTPGA